MLIAEHALALALAGLHGLPAAARASSWQAASVGSLQRQPVTVIGGGGIATALVSMLAPFEARVTVVRLHDTPMAGAWRTVTTGSLEEALTDARLVVLALALTPDTRHIIGRPELAAMHERAWLVNVSRGAHVDTDALVEALSSHAIGGAALDVTDPEPLPDGHRLWSLPTCIITPHSAGNSAAVMRLLGRASSTTWRGWRRASSPWASWTPPRATDPAGDPSGPPTCPAARRWRGATGR